MTEQQKQMIYEEYSANDMAKLKRIIYKPLSMFGGVLQMDYDDFLSRANLTLWQLAECFDETRGVPFDVFLRKRMTFKIMQEKTYEQREKRTPYLRNKEGERIRNENGEYLTEQFVCMDEVTEDGIKIGEKVASDFRIEDELPEIFGVSDKVEKYLDRLSSVQRDIVFLLSDGYSPDEIRDFLHISRREYRDNLDGIRAYENVKILY